MSDPETGDCIVCGKPTLAWWIMEPIEPDPYWMSGINVSVEWRKLGPYCLTHFASEKQRRGMA